MLFQRGGGAWLQNPKVVKLTSCTTNPKTPKAPKQDKSLIPTSAPPPPPPNQKKTQATKTPVQKQSREQLRCVLFLKPAAGLLRSMLLALRQRVAPFAGLVCHSAALTQDRPACLRYRSGMAPIICSDFIRHLCTHGHETEKERRTTSPALRFCHLAAARLWSWAHEGVELWVRMLVA